MEDRYRDFLNAGVKFVEQSADLPSALRELVRVASEAAGTDMGSFYQLNETRGVLEPLVLVNFPPDYLEGCQEVPLGHQCCGRAALHKIPWIVEDMWEDPLFAECRDAAKKAGIRSGFSIPVLDQEGRCLGTLGCQFRDQRSPSQDTIQRSLLFAQLIARSFEIHKNPAKKAHGVPLPGTSVA